MKTKYRMEKFRAYIMIQKLVQRKVGHLERPPTIDFPAAKCVWFYVLIIGVSVLAWRYPDIYQYLWVSQEAVFEKGQIYRLFTSIFLHADIVHLLSNGPLLLVFGYLLEAYFGLLVFPLYAVLLGVLSNLFTVLVYPPRTQLLGASGMLYGMAAMWLVYFMCFDCKHAPGQRLMRVLGFVGVVLMPSTAHEDTSYMAHLFGFIAGLAMAAISVPFYQRSPRTAVEYFLEEIEEEDDEDDTFM